MNFEYIYNGEDVAVIKPNNISVRVEEDKKFASDTKKSSVYILTKGQKMLFLTTFHIPASVVDMQFSKLFILWNGCFSVSKKMPLEGVEFEVVLDEELTKRKN